jgi:hypothetical protein
MAIREKLCIVIYGSAARISPQSPCDFKEPSMKESPYGPIDRLNG